MNIRKFGQSLTRAFRHLQIAGQGANTRARLTDASILLSDASEEIELALEDLQRANIDGSVRADPLRANDDETQAPRKFRLEGVGELSRGHAQ
jgi:hypothetical protein